MLPAVGPGPKVIMRLSSIFIAACMVLIAASAGAVVFLAFGFTGSETVTVAVAVLTALGLYNTVSTRGGAHAMVGNQLRDLASSNTNLARQVAEIGRTVAALQTRVEHTLDRTRAATDPLTIEIGELGTLVKQLADTAADHETRLDKLRRSMLAAATAPVARTEPVAAVQSVAAAAPAPQTEPLATAETKSEPKLEPKSELKSEPEPKPQPKSEFKPEPKTELKPEPKSVDADALLSTIRNAIEASRVDLYLQPIVTLPQRKVRYYEAMSRLRTEKGEVLQAADFHCAGGIGRPDAQDRQLVVFRCVQVVRRLLLKNRDVGLFCNLSASTLTDGTVFPQLLEFLDANRAIAPSIVLEFTQTALRNAGPDREREPRRARRPRLPLLARQRHRPAHRAARAGDARLPLRQGSGKPAAQSRQRDRGRHPSRRPLRPARLASASSWSPRRSKAKAWSSICSTTTCDSARASCSRRRGRCAPRRCRASPTAAT